MVEVRFEWDSKKSRINKAKHGVSFEEARTSFLDENARVIPDSDHSDEDRFVLLGLSVQLRKVRIRTVPTMKKHYDFSKSKANPYVRAPKKQVTIRLDASTIAYFKELSNSTGIPYQNLINLYLRDCAAEKKRLKLEWAA